MGSDLVNGGGGNDRIEQQPSGDADVLSGEADEDFIWSRAAETRQFNGGAGDDLLVQSNFYAPIQAEMHGGDGEDEGSFGNFMNEAVAVSLDDQANDGAPGTGTSNVHSDVKNINTGSGADIIVGSPGPNLIRSDASRSNFFLSDTAGGTTRSTPAAASITSMPAGRRQRSPRRIRWATRSTAEATRCRRLTATPRPGTRSTRSSAARA